MPRGKRGVMPEGGRRKPVAALPIQLPATAPGTMPTLEEVLEVRAYQERERCKSDVAYWMEKWAWTFDPKDLSEPEKRFVPWPKQREFLDWLKEREAQKEGGLVEKSRQVGVSYLCAAYALHGWLYRRGFTCGFGSRKLELVDKKGDPKCIFEKLRFILRRLPEHMLPRGFSFDDHDTLAKLSNPENGATITGEGGEQIGRGATCSIYFLDEAAFVDHPELVDRSLSATTDVRIDISTPNGIGNPFWKKRFSGRVPVFVFDWRDDERKNKTETLEDGRVVYPWYEKRKKELDTITLAQEEDRDYSAGIEGVVIPALWVRAAIQLTLDESDERMQAGLDVAEEGKNLTCYVSRRGPTIKTIRKWGECNTTQTAWRAAEIAEKEEVETLAYDHTGVGAGVRGIYNSHDKPLPFRTRAVNGGSSPTDDHWPDGKTSKEKFLNYRAESWWKMRLRFEKAYEYVEDGVQHPHEEMISIPNDESLISELSTCLAERTNNGKIKVESKKDMKKRNVKSPDVADAAVLAFAEGEHSVYHKRGLTILNVAPSSEPRKQLAAVGAGSEWKNPDDWAEDD